MKTQGKLIILSAPSGAGKSTLIHYLLSKTTAFEFSISCCTREKRTGEIEGKDYYFLSPEEFRKKRDANEFIEWEEVYEDHFYGTLRSEINRIWAKGKHVLFDIDVVGGINLKKEFGEQALSIFVQPPSLDTLADRLRNRQTDSTEKIEMRIAKAKKEMETASAFDWILINDKLDIAQEELWKKVNTFVNSLD